MTRSRSILRAAMLCAAAAGAGAAELDGAPAGRARPAWQARLATYSIASVAKRSGMRGWNEITQGNKVVLPAEVLDYLTSCGLPYDKFQLLNPDGDRALRLFTGPLDFCAAAGECYLPSWVMKQLGLKEGEMCAVATAGFPAAAFIKLQPHSSAWLDVCDNTAALTEAMEHLGGLTEGTTVRLCMAAQTFALDVVEVRGKVMASGKADDSGGKAVAIGLLECPFEFAEPKDLLKRRRKKEEAAAAKAKAKGAAAGEGGEGGEGGGASAAAKPAKLAKPAAAAAPPTEADAAAKPVPKFKRRAAEAAGEAEAEGPFVGKAKRLGGQAEGGEGGEGGEGAAAAAAPQSALAKARAAKAQAKEDAAAAAAAEEAAAAAAALAARPAMLVAAERVVVLLREFIKLLLRLLHELLKPTDVRFDA